MLDIIIVNYNSTDYLLKSLESTYDSLGDVPANVFVQDNASDDDVNRISVLFPQVHVTHNTQNLGFSAAVNKGIKEGSSPYILLLNPDTYVKKGFFGSVIKKMAENPDVAILGSKILDHDGSIQGSARSFPSPLTALFGRSTILTRFFPNNRFTRSNVITTVSDGKTPMEVDWVSGACMVVRRKAVEDVGLMDERFFMYWEDADWCKRMWENGWKVIYFPLASVVHFVGISSSKRPLRSILDFHKSSYLLFAKYARWPLSMLKPVAFAGLSLRFYILFILQLFRYPIDAFSRLREGERLGLSGKIKILRIISRLNIGGPSIHVHLLTKGLNSDAFESILVTGKISPHEGDMSYLFDSHDKKPMVIPQLQREISLGTDIKAVIQMLKILIKERPDIVHTHTAKAGSGARLAVIIYNMVFNKKIRAIHTFHGHIFKGYFSRVKSWFFVFIERTIAKLTDVIIAISETQKKELAQEFRIAPQDKIKTIQLGFDLKPFLTCRSLKGKFKKSLGIDPDIVTIGIVGRLAPIKNHRMFFDAAKIFVAQNPGIRVKFVVVGDGELRNELEDYCKKINLNNQVIFCGWIRNVSDVYADLDLLALTSINEGTPVSIIESMAASVPVISTDAGGVHDLLGATDPSISSDGFEVCERGIISPKGDPLSFAKGLKFLLKDEKSNRAGRLKRARLFVKKMYSQKRLLADMESLYHELQTSSK